MVTPNLPIKWDKKAKEGLDYIYQYIQIDSEEAAKRVKKELIRLAGSLADFPEKFPTEPLMENQPGNFRCVSKWSYKIIYEITDQEIIITYIMHTKRDISKLLR